MSLSPLSALPVSLAGRTVLDVGCGNGTLARAAQSRGATVVGIDIDPEFVAQAREISSPAIDFQVGDLEVELPAGHFDHVVCHNLLHRVRNPVEVLDRLTDAARRSLVLEVTGPDAERPQRLLRRDYQAVEQTKPNLASLPVAVVGRHGTPTRKREQKFFFSESALQNILREQRRSYASFTTTPLAQPGRYIACAVKRQIGQLVLITGLTGSGKSTFVKKVLDGDLATATVADLPRVKWESINSSDAHNLGSEIGSLLYHYDLLRPWRRDAGVHDRDEGLDVLGSAQTVAAVVLITKRAVLRDRLQRELATTSGLSERQIRRLREVIRLYESPDRTADRVQAFLDYCSQRCVSVRFVQASGDYKRLHPAAWRDVLEGRSDG